VYREFFFSPPLLFLSFFSFAKSHDLSNRISVTCTSLNARLLREPISRGIVRGFNAPAASTPITLIARRRD